MDIFEYSEAHWPTRALQQEEEEQAQSTAAANLQEPEVAWVDGAPLVDGALQADLLIVATNAASCALIDHCFPGSKELGSIAPAAAGAAGAEAGADLDVIYGGRASTRPRRRASSVLALALPPTGGAPAAAAAVCCREDVPPEHAGAWARALLRAAAPAAVLILGSIGAEHYRGAGDPSQEFLAFSLQTTEQRRRREAAGGAGARAGADAGAAPPPLPSGSIAAGLPAALLAAAELRGGAAQLLVTVDQVPALLPDGLPRLAAGAAALLDAAAVGGGGAAAAAAAAAGALRDAGRVAAARAELEQLVGRARAVGSVYV